MLLSWTEASVGKDKKRSVRSSRESPARGRQGYPGCDGGDSEAYNDLPRVRLVWAEHVICAFLLGGVYA